MFTSAELIEALRRRTRRSLRPPPPPGEFPPGWRDWFAAMAALPGRVSGAFAEDIVALMAAREPAVTAASVQALGRWRAFTTLWRQDWQPGSRDERWMRIVSMTTSLFLHVLFVAALAWLMFFSGLYFPVPAEEAREGEEHVLQVEYIGEGTPDDAGGGAPEAPLESPREPASAAAATAAAVAPPEPVTRAVPPPDSPQPPVETPTPAERAPEPATAFQPPPAERELSIEVPRITAPSIPAPQELQATEVELPDPRFEVPPPRDLSVVEVPAADATEVPVRRRDIEVEIPAEPVRLAAPRPPRELELAVPRASPRGVEVREREIELAEAPRAPVVAARELAAPAPPGLAAEAPAARVRELPMPAARPPGADRAQAGTAATGAAPAAGTPEPGEDPATAPRGPAGEGSAPTSATASPGGRPRAGGGAREAPGTAGAGRQPGLPPGALPSGRTSDDWGDSSRQVPGRQAGRPGASGLFNADGSPRLADGGRVGGGLPPGTITEDFENIDRHGTWLKRPPYDYEPTTFDRFWLPTESLLEEWVRRSVTEVRIPIPGTTKTIRCVTILLAAGGACDIVDPNLQEQPASARKPPDIPFKRELQEDQDSLGPPPPQSPPEG